MGHARCSRAASATKSAATTPATSTTSDKKDPTRRWVIYNGANDGSRVPPGWQLWLRGTIDELPEKALPPVRKFQTDADANLTGTMAAFRPDGALGSGKIRPASTGDYEPWIPE